MLLNYEFGKQFLIFQNNSPIEIVLGCQK